MAFRLIEAVGLDKDKDMKRERLGVADAAGAPNRVTIFDMRGIHVEMARRHRDVHGFEQDRVRLTHAILERVDGSHFKSQFGGVYHME